MADNNSQPEPQNKPTHESQNKPTHESQNKPTHESQNNLNNEDTLRLKIDNKEEGSSEKDVTRSPQRGRKGSLLYFYLLSLFGVLITAVGLKFYFSFFHNDPMSYKTNFYTWRVSHADVNMYKTMWKYVKKNKYPVQDLDHPLTKLVNYAQDKQMLFTGHPEHFPRQQKHYNTHSDCKFNRDFLKFRKSVCFAYDTKLTPNELSGTTQLKEKSMKYWVGKGTGETVDELLMAAPPMIQEFMGGFTIFLNKIHTDVYKNTELIGSTVPKEIVQDIHMLTKIAGLDVDESYIETVPINFAKVKPNAFESFAYSRLFYLFYFCTLDAKLDIPVDPKAKEGKVDDAGRIKLVSNCFTELLSNLFAHDFGAGFSKRGEIMKIFLRLLGPNRASFTPHEQEIDALMKRLNEVVKPVGNEIKTT